MPSADFRGQGGLFGQPRHDDPNAFADTADRAVRSLAERFREFTTDEVRDALRDWNVAEPRQLGPVMMRAQKAGWIAATDRTRPSSDPACHGRRKAVWQSLLRPT